MNVKSILKAFAVISVLFMTQFCDAQIYFVNHAATGANNGSNWTNAYVDLQDALAVASSGEEIWVAQGIYYPTLCSPCTAADRNISFDIPDGVKVFGGFDGTETMASQRDWVCNPTSLNGDINQDGAPTGNSFSIVYTLRVSLSTIVDGFTIREGCADLTGGSGREINGAGWYNDGSAGFVSNPMIRNVRFVLNKAERGAGMFNAGGFNGEASPILQHTKFINNSAASDGGACLNEGTFDGNSSPQYYSCEFTDNTSNGSGAAVFNNATGIKDAAGNITHSGVSNPFFFNVIFKNNTGFTTSGIGGALYNLGSKGGECMPSIINCLFVDNKAYAAGAMYNHGGDEGLCSPSVINCTFANNEADPFNYGGGTGGAIYNNGSLNGTSAPTILNSIFSGNIGDFDSEVFRNIGGTPFIAFSLVDKPDCASMNSGNGGTVACGNGMIYNGNPLFVDPAICDFRLQDNSPALNVGDNTVNGSAIDLDSVPRIQAGTIDFGPYENQNSVLPIELLVFDGTYDGAANVDLIWAAINDSEFGKFEIERSGTDYEFETIKRMDASEELNIPVSYKTVDENPLVGKNYYRLKVIEDNGRIYYSKVIEIEVLVATVVTYPNPATDFLVLKFKETDISGTLEYFIYDIDGKEMLNKQFEAENEVLIPVQYLSPGMHTIMILDQGNQILSKQFIVTKL